MARPNAGLACGVLGEKSAVTTHFRFPLFEPMFNRRRINRKVASMTGVTFSSAELDPRRRRILFRCWHRGIREMDLVFGQFANNKLATLSEADLDDLERIMAEEDNDLLKWILGTLPVPEHLKSPTFDCVAAYKPDYQVAAATIAREAE
jgi:antitoxin CptB